MPSYMNIEWFLRTTLVRNTYLDEPEWQSLYVRRGHVGFRLAGTWTVLDDSIHLASFEAKKKRRGAFTRLIERIEKAAPGLPIFVENLFDSAFGDKLIERGFEEVFTCPVEMEGTIPARCFIKRYPDV